MNASDLGAYNDYCTATSLSLVRPNFLQSASTNPVPPTKYTGVSWLIDWLIDHVDEIILRSQNCGHQRAYVHPPGDVSVKIHSDDDTGCRKVTRPPELSGSPTSRVI
jgi:hypothetical protein